MKKNGLFLFLIFFLILTNTSFAFEKQTHEAINLRIANSTINGFSLNSYLMSMLGFDKGVEESFENCPAEILGTYNEACTVRNLLQWGGKKEDEPLWRSFRHFHNPLENWDRAGLKGSTLGRSSIIWAQSRDQSYGKYSWQDVRDYFYFAFTLILQRRFL